MSRLIWQALGLITLGFLLGRLWGMSSVHSDEIAALQEQVRLLRSAVESNYEVVREIKEKKR